MNKVCRSLTTFTKKIVYTNIFAKVPMAPPDPIIGIGQAYMADTDTRKVNLGVGAYRDDNSMPVVFKVVKEVQKQIIADKTMNKEYTNIDGIPAFNLAAQRLIFGADSQHIKAGRISTAQSLSGTGSLRIGFQFIKQQLPSIVLIPNPTWANHQNVIRKSGLTFSYYPYYNPTDHKINISKTIDFLSKASKGNIVLLHACAHNPTGVDPSLQEWKKLSAVIKEKQLIPYFDSAYQGFASGDLEKDIQSVRYFAKEGHTLFVSQSFAKNMGLYGQRVGALHIVTPDKETSARVGSQVKNIIRANYSSPPLHGARIAEKVLNNSQNFTLWKNELAEIAKRVILMRHELKSKLQYLKTEGNWNHITDQIGMFSYTGLNEQQVRKLTTQFHIHMVKNGRIAMVGLNSKNVSYVAEAIHNVVTTVK